MSKKATGYVIVDDWYQETNICENVKLDDEKIDKYIEDLMFDVETSMAANDSAEVRVYKLVPYKIVTLTCEKRVVKETKKI